jgi:hypothetical protein
MAISQKLRSASSIMAWLSLSGAVLLTIAVPLSFLAPNPTINLGGDLRLGFTADDVTAAIPLVHRALALAVTAVPVGCFISALVVLFRLFRLYAAGRVFDLETLRFFKLVTTLLFWAVLTKPIAQSANMYLLHLYLRQTWIAFKFDTENLGFLFLAGVALVISRVMTEAKKLADENAKFV